MMTSSSKGSRRRLTGRTVPDKARRFEIQVFAEGEKTEELYLTHWNRNNRDVNVVIARHETTSPMRLVQAAIAAMKIDRRRPGRYGKAFDEYWCVFDEDEHDKLIEALNLAAEHGVKVAFSGPCIELWFLLHFQDQNANIHRRVAQRVAYGHMGCGGKSCLTHREVEMLDTLYDEAMDRAVALRRKHALDGTEPPWNPYSNVYELTETISKGEAIEGSGMPHHG
jgi:hypothetical protein